MAGFAAASIGYRFKMADPKSLDELFSKRPSIPTVIMKGGTAPLNNPPAQTIIETNMPNKKPHGSQTASIRETFRGRELTVNALIEHLKVKDPKLSEASVRSMVAGLRKRNELIQVRKNGREPVLTLSNGEPQKAQAPLKFSSASGGLAADIAALESALATLEGVKPVVERLKTRLAKLSEVI
jgi:hypothetical protein